MSKRWFGKIVSTHGIKGEIKLLSDFAYRERVYTKDFSLYIDEVEYKIKNARPHKQYELVLLNDYNNINEVLFLVNKNVYIEESDLQLKENEYLLEDLIDAQIKEKNEFLGKITEVLKGEKNNFVRVKIKDKGFLIPLIEEYIEYFDKESKTLYTKNAKNLIL